MGFTKYDIENKAVEPRVLTVEEKKILTDAFINGEGVTSVKHRLFIPSSLIKESYAKKKAIEQHIVALMNERVVIENGENIVYNVKPSTLTKLRTESKKAFPECDQEAFDYNIDKIIDVATTAGTWTAFKALF